MNTREVITELRTDRPSIAHNAQVVGRWVWVIFNSLPRKEDRAWLIEHGYKYNGKRHVWQHNCGIASTGAPYDPRAKYGIVSLAGYQDDEARP